jgi:hypothetical protein
MNLCYLGFLILDGLLIQTSTVQFIHNQINYKSSSQINKLKQQQIRLKL